MGCYMTLMEDGQDEDDAKKVCELDWRSCAARDTDDIEDVRIACNGM